MNSEFVSKYIAISDAAGKIYINPEETYKYDDIIKGIKIENKTMMAVDKSTFQAFGRFTPNMFKVQECYIAYFIKNKESIIKSLNSISSDDDIEKIESKIFSDIHASLENETDKERLNSYNRIRKPINLYLQHISFMAREINNRENLSKYLLLPLDRIIFGIEFVFTEEKRKLFGISKSKGFGQIKEKGLYEKIQKYIKTKAIKIENEIGKPFKAIYFDLFWNDRYMNNPKNLFYSNIKTRINDLHFYEEKLVGNNFDKNNKTFLNNDEHILKEEFDQSEIIKRMVKAPSFYKKYENADLKLKSLFMKLINMVDRKGIFNKATKIPDYRLVEKNEKIKFLLDYFFE
ncbi:hypothetical protein CcarbDRAFT_1703 [Clostridium carboxidivorans P7]|uniref:Uncharacterized protein n=1 Tax=Clostridium carboxidivorans P7 TaxID=536227 RepID=C6PSD6_9CLOT|nr:hypothetical protein [Clostridium carboxidivorans]EET87814.1 hypothetical protein CcarbDRAFT_1703 [Clostridium carboxidivorans P7]